MIILAEQIYIYIGQICLDIFNLKNQESSQSPINNEKGSFYANVHTNGYQG